MAFLPLRGFLWRRSLKRKPRRGKIKMLIIFVLPQTNKIIMQQVDHFNAKTNLNIRFQLQNNFGTNSDLASRFKIG